MQDNFNKDFDLSLREMLQDAEVKPSGRVWRGVKSRLAEPVAEAPALWWRWAVAGLAAAALAAAVVLPTHLRQAVDTEVLLAKEEASPAIEETAPIETEPFLTQNISDLLTEAVVPAKPRTTHGRKTATAPVSEVTAPQDAQVAEEQEDVCEDQPVQENDLASESVSEKVTVDPFSQMAWEDSHEASRPGLAFTLEGGLCGNDSDAAIAGSPSRFAGGVGSGNVAGISERSESAYGIPLSFGAGVRFYLTPSLSLGTGVNYSVLTRTFTGTYTEKAGVPASITDGNVLHTIQYVGIPLGVYYDIIKTGDFLFYAYGNGQAEFCVSNKYDIKGSNGRTSFSDPVKTPQYSLGAGIGVEFKVSDNLGLYLDPGARYYFDCGQPKSIRTDRPFMISFEAGLRLDI